MKTDFFHLQVIPVANILPHEAFDVDRAKPLMERLQVEQVQVNPILVAQVDDGKFLQLDGMNRFSAFKMLGIPSILAQIIDYNDQDSVELASWLHMFAGDEKAFFDKLTSIEGAVIINDSKMQIRSRYIQSDGEDKISKIVTSSGKSYLVSCDGSLVDKLRILNKIVDSYDSKIIRGVLSSPIGAEEQQQMFAANPGVCIMVAFPTFARHQIVKAVKQGATFPSGVTRFIFKRRCLNVNAPLSIFQNGRDVNAQNEELEQVLSKRNYRLYEEPTVYFE